VPLAFHELDPAGRKAIGVEGDKTKGIKTTVYGITSLESEKTASARLAALVRGRRYSQPGFDFLVIWEFA
jgi:hypothetical protein